MRRIETGLGDDADRNREKGPDSYREGDEVSVKRGNRLMNLRTGCTKFRYEKRLPIWDSLFSKSD